MKFSGVTFSIHPVKGRIERTVVLDEVIYLGRRFWKSRADWFDHEHGRSFNPRARWMLDPATVTPLSPDSPLLQPCPKTETSEKEGGHTRSRPARRQAGWRTRTVAGVTHTDESFCSGKVFRNLTNDKRDASPAGISFLRIEK